MRANAVALWGADAGGTPLERCAAARIGSRSSSATKAPDSRPKHALASSSPSSLPIGTTVESLNVAVATGILLYQLRT